MSMKELVSLRLFQRTVLDPLVIHELTPIASDSVTSDGACRINLRHDANLYEHLHLRIDVFQSE
jgi:hypothetical protein